MTDSRTRDIFRPSPMGTGANKFYLTPRGGECTSWDIRGPVDDSLPVDCHYFGAALRYVDEHLPNSDLRFHMVWSLDSLPEAGPNVVVLMIGDERYQVPRYAGDVLAVFKTGALEPFSPYAGLEVNSWLKLLDTARAARDRALRARRGVPHELLKRGVFPMPLGYFKQVDLPVVPLKARTSDVFFAGGRGPEPTLRSPKTWMLRPRDMARATMFQALDELRRISPDVRCDAITVGPGQPPLGPRAYSERLMNAKISLCPRGNFPETFRFFESARAGCVIVSEPLPDTWYFRDHPAVIVGDWSEAPAAVAELLASPQDLEDVHTRTLEWWNEVASEPGLGRFITERLKTRLESSTAA